jgi:hypothetical protein
MPGSVRTPLGRDAPTPLRFLGLRRGSVGPAETHSVSSSFSRLARVRDRRRMVSTRGLMSL